MPNWNVHLEVAKRLNKKLKYRKDNLSLFLIGNILPDINNCYIVKDISKRKKSGYTHFNDKTLFSYKVFYKKYKNNLNNPLILGYFCHLYTDYIWNYNFYREHKNKIELKILSRLKLRRLKQADFKCYDDLYIENTINIDNIDLILENILLIDRVSLTKEDLIKVKKYLDNQMPSNLNYNFYTKEELDKLMVKTIDKIEYFINKLEL